MARTQSGWTRRRAVGFVAIVVALVSAAGVGSLYAASSRTGHVKQTLTATAAAPSAHGKARLVIRSSSKGRFSIVASRLAGGKTFDVIVGGVKVGELHTNSGGRGRTSFSTQPGTNSVLLGFDPRGDHVMVRSEDDGEDVLVGDMPDDADPGDVACCFSDGEGESECEETSADECTAEGGSPVGVPGGTAAASCLPNPCASTPPADRQVVCCKNATHDDESEAECEQVESEAECAGDEGMVVAATSCDPNPCEVTPPTDAAACCVTRTDDDGDTEAECRVISSDACSAAGGAPAGVASCSNDPCGGEDSGGDDGSSEDGGGD
jgi:hypothetical protein